MLDTIIKLYIESVAYVFAIFSRQILSPVQYINRYGQTIITVFRSM